MGARQIAPKKNALQALLEGLHPVSLPLANIHASPVDAQRSESQVSSGDGFRQVFWLPRSFQQPSHYDPSQQWHSRAERVPGTKQSHPPVWFASTGPVWCRVGLQRRDRSRFSRDSLLSRIGTWPVAKIFRPGLSSVFPQVHPLRGFSLAGVASGTSRAPGFMMLCGSKCRFRACSTAICSLPSCFSSQGAIIFPMP